VTIHRASFRRFSINFIPSLHSETKGHPNVMAGVKRSRDASQSEKKLESDSPYIPMFETFRAELDEHHDRRERIIKASRDITAQSKKM
jgi:hypothetical protein